jgi:transposase InsO family protein
LIIKVIESNISSNDRLSIFIKFTKLQLLQSIIRLFREHVIKFEHKCKRLHSDYESVSRDAKVIEWLEQQGVESTYLAPYHHQANGVAERTVRKLLDSARTLMIEAAMAPSLHQYGCMRVYQSFTY